MFHKIRIHLVLLNVAVLFLILLISGALLYVSMEHRLNEEIDESLVSMAGPIHVTPGADKLIIRPVRRFIDTPIVALQWNRDGQLIEQSPDNMFGEEDLQKFQALLTDTEPQTASLDGNTYRVLTVAVEPPPSPVLRRMFDVQAVQLVRNINREQAILDQLLLVLIISTLAGGLVTVFAGFFLAGRALVPIRKSWEQQQQFVADASHELRTPLAVIGSHAELLLRHPDQTIEQQSRNIGTVYRETKRMGKLVQSLLTLAGQDSGKAQISRAPLRLDELVLELAEEFRILADVQGLELESVVDGAATLDADESRIRQLLVILLDNALKYTPEPGRVKLVCRRAGNGAEVIVEDTGIGLAPEEVPYIFDRFYRGDKARSREDGGSGLGLSIAKWIVDVHGGRIRVESRPGSGTKMIVWLPGK